MKEKVRVLVVDDSSFFRGRIRHELECNDQILVVGEAVNGVEAVGLAARLRPDLITMDVAMPKMDGITAVREIMRDHPTDIIMVSAATRAGAEATLDALQAGAIDFVCKQDGIAVRSGDVSADGLSDRILKIARGRHGVRPPPADGAPVERPRVAPLLVVVGASTGGPVAVQQVLSRLPADYPYPVLVAVHMPADFTASFASRLDGVSRIKVKHAEHADLLLPGLALIAPGGMQTQVESRGGRLRVRVTESVDQLYRPSVDVMFGSAARALNERVQAVLLTGMGSDGTEGARQLKQRGSSVWSQDQATSVVYGMPRSVAKAGLTDRVLPLDEIGAALSGLA